MYNEIIRNSVNKYVFKFFLNFSEFLSARSVAGSEFQAIGACDEKARERAAVECIVDLGRIRLT